MDSFSGVEGEVAVVHRRATVAELHALDPFAPQRLGGTSVDPTVWWCDPVDAAIVLGSRQPDELVDPAAVERAGLSVVRRRSGGGAVFVHPDVVWVDLVVPAAAAPALVADVRRSMIWAGDRWRAALVDLGVPSGRLSVHTGGLVETAWSPYVCFAGFGPGEVLLDGRKLVGLSQRRTRHGVRIQGQVHRAGSLAPIVALLAAPVPVEPLDDAAEWPALGARDLAEVLARSVTRSLADAGRSDD